MDVTSEPISFQACPSVMDNVTSRHKSNRLKEKFDFLHIKPYNKDIYDHIRCSMTFYDEWLSLESWSSLLTSPLAENNREA